MDRKISLKYWGLWLAEQYKNLAKLYIDQHPFKVIGKEISEETGETFFIIKVEHRMPTLKMTATEIIEKNDFVEGFSKKDVQVITYQFFLDTNQPQYELVGEKRTDFGTAVILKDHKTATTHVRNVSDYNGIKDYITKLNPKPAFRIGYLFGLAAKQVKRAKNSK